MILEGLSEVLQAYSTKTVVRGRGHLFVSCALKGIFKCMIDVITHLNSRSKAILYETFPLPCGTFCDAFIDGVRSYHLHITRHHIFVLLV